MARRVAVLGTAVLFLSCVSPVAGNPNKRNVGHRPWHYIRPKGRGPEKLSKKYADNQLVAEGTKHWTFLLVFLYFGVLLLFQTCEVTIQKRNARRRGEDLFRYNIQTCPALAHFHGWMTLAGFCLGLLFFVCQAVLKVDECWDDSLQIYSGPGISQVAARTRMDFWHKSVGLFTAMLMLQLSVWDTTPATVALAIAPETVEEERAESARATTHEERRLGRRVRRTRRRLRARGRSALEVNWPYTFACGYYYIVSRLLYVVVKILQKRMGDTKCSQYSSSGPNSVSMDYATGTFLLLSFLRFTVKVRKGSVYHASSYSLASFLWKVFGGCQFNTTQEKIALFCLVLLCVFHGVIWTIVLETGINSLRQCFYGILVGMMALAPFTWALDVIIPEGIEINLPSSAAPAEQTDGHRYGPRRYRIIRLMGTLAVAYFFVFLTGLMTLMAHVRNATMLNGWFGIDILVWCFLVFVFLKKLAAPRQGFVGYSEVVTSQGAWEL